MSSELEIMSKVAPVNFRDRCQGGDVSDRRENKKHGLRTNRFRQLGRDIKSRVRKLAVREESGGNSVHSYFDGDTAFGAMIAAIRGATESVMIEMYQFDSDSVGQMFAEDLIAKAQEGVKVRLIYDSAGSINADREMFQRIRDAGGQVVEFRPIAPFRKGSGWMGRDHRKIIVVDQEIGFVGGMNLADEWSNRAFGDMAWRDTHLRITGPAVNDLMSVSADIWEVATGEVLEIYDAEKKQRETGEAKCLVVAGTGRGRRRIMRRLFTHELGQAQEAVQISMPYFAPVGKLLRSVLHTARRGLDVELITPAKSDVGFVDLVKEGLYPALLKRGVKIWEYHGPMFHAKTIAIDGDRSMVGSSNFDLLSLTMNREIVVMVTNDPLQDILSVQFTEDLLYSERLTAEHLKQRPWYRRMTTKFLGWILRCFW